MNSYSKTVRLLLILSILTEGVAAALLALFIWADYPLDSIVQLNKMLGAREGASYSLAGDYARASISLAQKAMTVEWTILILMLASMVIQMISILRLSKVARSEQVDRLR